MKKLYIKLTRFFSNNEISGKLNLVLTAVCLFLFVSFAIPRTISKVSKKMELIKEMKDVNISFNEKIAFLQSSVIKVDEAKKYTLYLDEYLPEKVNSEDFLSDAVYISGKYDYVLINYSTGTSDGNEYPVRISLKGTGDISPMIKDFENLKRITQINKISVENTEENILVTLDVYVFSFENSLE